MYASEERAGPGSQIKHSSEWLVHSKECLVSLASYWLHTPVFGCLHTWYWWPMLLAEYPTPSTESPNYWSDKDLFSHLRISLELSKFSPSMNFPWARFSERRWRHDLFPCDFPICLVSKVSLNALLPGIHSTGIISISVSSLEYFLDIAIEYLPNISLEYLPDIALLSQQRKEFSLGWLSAGSGCLSLWIVDCGRRCRFLCGLWLEMYSLMWIVVA